MKLKDYKLIITVTGLIGILLVATPALINIIGSPGGEQFSELYLLGPKQTIADYPYNIAADQNYSVYANVVNYQGASAFYVLYVKFQNMTDPLPDPTSMMPSSVPPLYEYQFSVPNGKTWDSLLTFSISNATIVANQSVVKTVTINNFKYEVNTPDLFGSKSTAFNYRIVFELWLYNATSNSIQFSNRFVDLELNLTRSTS